MFLLFFSPILLPVEEALYAYDHLKAKIKYKKTFLRRTSIFGKNLSLKFDDFDDDQVKTKRISSESSSELLSKA